MLVLLSFCSGDPWSCNLLKRCETYCRGWGVVQAAALHAGGLGFDAPTTGSHSRTGVLRPEGNPRKTSVPQGGALLSGEDTPPPLGAGHPLPTPVSETGKLRLRERWGAWEGQGRPRAAPGPRRRPLQVRGGRGLSLAPAHAQHLRRLHGSQRRPLRRGGRQGRRGPRPCQGLSAGPRRYL